MERKIARLVLAGTSSNCGKTTVCCAILQALVNRGLKVGAYKCGPDYIDPMFHSRVIGARAANLDAFFFSGNTLRYLLARGEERDISIIEGVMGFYDGMSMSDTRSSTYDVAQKTQSPVVLVVNAKGAALSVLATIHGFLTFLPENGICGVILNQCTAMTYSLLCKSISEKFGNAVRPLGYLPNLPECALESRHLGLITAEEVQNLHEKLDALAAQAEKSIDLAGLLQLAQAAPDIRCEAVSFPAFGETVRIAVAMDKAFCFYYEDNLQALREMGAEIVPFCPLSDTELPANIHGLYLGGGYPELYGQKLSENVNMRTAIRNALQNGLPCIAECGGFMYLTESIEEFPMVGFLPGRCTNAGKLVRFGYIRLKAKSDNMLCRAGKEIPAHEFHYWDCSQNGSDFTAAKPSGKSWDCAVATDTLYAGFPHFHFYANPDFAANFYRACLKEKHHD